MMKSGLKGRALHDYQFGARMLILVMVVSSRRRSLCLERISQSPFTAPSSRSSP